MYLLFPLKKKTDVFLLLQLGCLYHLNDYSTQGIFARNNQINKMFQWHIKRKYKSSCLWAAGTKLFQVLWGNLTL